jgi:GNT-I family
MTGCENPNRYIGSDRILSQSLNLECSTIQCSPLSCLTLSRFLCPFCHPSPISASTTTSFALSSLFLLPTSPTPSLPTTFPPPPQPTTAPLPSLLIPPTPLSPFLLLFLLLFKRKGRQFIRPEICRTLHFGQHGVSDAQYSDVRTLYSSCPLSFSPFFSSSISSPFLFAIYSFLISPVLFSLLFSFLHPLYFSLLIFSLLLFYPFLHY